MDGAGAISSIYGSRKNIGRTNKNHPPVMTMAEDSNRKRTACQAFDKISRSFQRVKAISGWLSNNGTNNNAANNIHPSNNHDDVANDPKKNFFRF